MKLTKIVLTYTDDSGREAERVITITKTSVEFTSNTPQVIVYPREVDAATQMCEFLRVQNNR